MSIAYDKFLTFAAKNGNVTIFPGNDVERFDTGVVNLRVLIEEKAPQFGVSHRLYSRAEFEKLMNQ